MGNVTTTPAIIGEDPCLIQNLGPDILYVGYQDVTSSNGVQVASGGHAVIGETNDPVYVVSVGTSDVRILGRGENLYSPPASS